MGNFRPPNDPDPDSADQNECGSVTLAPVADFLTAPEHNAITAYVLGTPLNPSVAQVLAALAYHHPHQTVPFMKALLSTAAHIMKVTRKECLEKEIYNNIIYVGLSTLLQWAHKV